jgi:signal peptidase I
MLGLDYAVVASDSMKPNAVRGDLVLLQSRTEFQIGDVVTFHRSGRVVLHRIVEKIGNQEFRTKGDANTAMDPWVLPQSDLQSTAVGRIRNLGWPLLWMNFIFRTPSVDPFFFSTYQLANHVDSQIFQALNLIWVRYENFQYISITNDGRLFINGFGNRKFYLHSYKPGDTRIFFKGKIVDPYPINKHLLFFLNSCIGNSPDLNCGWLVEVRSDQANLYLISDRTRLTDTPGKCSFNQALNLSSTNTVLVYKSGKRIGVRINGTDCILANNVDQYVPENMLPTGDKSGFWIDGGTGVQAEKFVVF